MNLLAVKNFRLMHFNLKSNGLHSLSICNNLQLVTIKSVSKTSSTFQVLNQNEKSRPLILLYSWTLSKDKHVMKYANFYSDLGFDVLKVRTLPKDLLFPTKGSQVVAGQVLEFLHSNSNFSPLLVHGLSVGAYSFGEVIVKILNESPRHDYIKDKFIGQIWDSAVDVYGLSSALSKVLTENEALQPMIKSLLDLHLKVNYNIATKHYNYSSKMIHDNPLRTPGLFIFSEADLASPPEMNSFVYNKWEHRGDPVYHRCFKDSGHVSHFMKYPEEYKNELMWFLDKIGLITLKRKSMKKFNT